MSAESLSITADDFKSPWEYARYRLKRLFRSPDVRLEFAVVGGLFLALFGLAIPSWWLRWTATELGPAALLQGKFWLTLIQFPQTPQGYAVFILPLTLVWLWLNRYHVALPELDSLNERFTDRSVIRFLVEEEPEEPKRLRWPFLLACVFTVFALWTGEPTYTCLAFVGLLTGLIGWRHGTQALRVLAFPLAFLAAMIPVPGPLIDFVVKRLQPILFKITTTLINFLGTQAEITPDANPIEIPPDNPNGYSMFAGQVGVGFAEAGFFLLLVAFYLSLVQAPFRAKLGSFVCGVVWIGVVMIVRLWCLGWFGGNFANLLDGRETMSIVAPISRWLLPVAGFAGQLLIMRGLKCREFHEWVSR